MKFIPLMTDFLRYLHWSPGESAENSWKIQLMEGKYIPYIPWNYYKYLFHFTPWQPHPHTIRVSSASNEALDNFFGLLPLLLEFKPLEELLTVKISTMNCKNLNHYFWMHPSGTLPILFVACCKETICCVNDLYFVHQLKKTYRISSHLLNDGNQ